MIEYRGVEFLDFLVHLVKWKRFLLILSIIIVVITYTTVYFLIPPQYDSTATIVATEETAMNPIGMLSRSISNLPLASFGIGNFSATEKYDLFNTFVYSRTMLEKMINRFQLYEDYNIKPDRIDLALEAISGNIKTEITKTNAFSITLRAASPDKSAEMNNYLVSEINKAVIDLNTKKSRENRKFLEDRYAEIQSNLSGAEDSLKLFQNRYGLLSAEDQTKAILEVYSDLEKQLAVKEIELSVQEKLLGSDRPEIESSRESVQQFKQYVNKLKSGEEIRRPILPLNSLPENILNYYRYYREVEINNAMLQFIIPLYEQSRYEEIKNIPVLQIIDNAYPPVKKSFPPRVFFSVLITFFVVMITALLLFILEQVKVSENSKLKFIKKEIFNFSSKGK